MRLKILPSTFTPLEVAPRAAGLLTGFTMLLIFATLSSAAVFSVFTGEINENNVNVRVDATIGAAVACTLAKGELVEVISEAYDWYKIRLPKAAPSYIKKKLVECINFDNAKPAECLNAKVTGSRVNIRLGPGESSWILGKVDKLTVVNILKDEGAWYKIEPVHQSYGWVNKKFVNKDLSKPKKVIKLPTAVLQPPPVALPNGRQTISLCPNQLVIEGTVSPYGVVLWRKATHKLVTVDNKIYFLKGNRKGLDSLNYHRVKVTGKLISPKNNKYPIIEAAIIEALN